MSPKFKEMSIGLSFLVCVLPLALAQDPTKADVISALGEMTYDAARFERIVTLAKSMGVSKSRIVMARFDRDWAMADLNALKRALPEYEAALGSVPADETDSGLAEFRENFTEFKKTLNSTNIPAVNAVPQRYKQRAEADAIVQDLRRIDAAVSMCAVEKNLPAGTTLTPIQWLKHVRVLSQLRETGTDIFGNRYGNQIVDKAPVPNPASLEKIGKIVPPDYFDITKKN